MPLKNKANIQPFETFVVGSLPRPRWVLDVIEKRLNNQLSEKEGANLLDPAVLSAIKMQEQAGLDFISDGEYRRENYVRIFADNVKGFKRTIKGADQEGRIQHEAYVVSKIEQFNPIAVKDASFLRKHTNRKIIVALPAPYTIGRRMWDQKVSSKAYPNRTEFVWDCVPILKNEINELIKIGVDAIQLDEPWLAKLVDPKHIEDSQIQSISKEISLSVDTINSIVDNFPNNFINVHFCRAHGYRKHGSEGKYDPIMEALTRMNVSRFAMEYATPVAGGIESLENFPSNKILGLGVIDHTSTNIESHSTIKKRVNAALKYVKPEMLTLNPDCGFAPSALNPMDMDEAYLKLKSMCETATLLKKEL